jgi:DNA-binding transcriptional LysR family regulator
MNLHQFEALYWIGRLGSFHAAARHLKTSQPAISGRIRDLELELGVTLFDRTQRKVKPTPKGHELLQYAAELMKITDQIRRTVGAREIVAGRVRMGVTGVAALTWARALIERMKFSYPEVSIELTVEASELLGEQLEEGQLDLAVLAGPVESNKIICERLGRVPMSWLASPSLNLPRTPLSAVEIARFPIISGMPGTYLHAAAIAWFRAHDVEPRHHHACSSLNLRIQLAAQGLGIALAAVSAASRELRDGSLEIVVTEHPMPAIEYVIACPAFGMSNALRIVAETAKLLIGQKPDLESYYSAAERLIQWTDDSTTISSSII